MYLVCACLHFEILACKALKVERNTHTRSSVAIQGGRERERERDRERERERERTKQREGGHICQFGIQLHISHSPAAQWHKAMAMTASEYTNKNNNLGPWGGVWAPNRVSPADTKDVRPEFSS